MPSWFKRRQHQAGIFVLSGYETSAEYEHREPAWQPDDEFVDIESATAAAIDWRVAKSVAAQVEVVELVAGEGHVRRVVDESGIEEIG